MAKFFISSGVLASILPSWFVDGTIIITATSPLVTMGHHRTLSIGLPDEDDPVDRRK